LICPIALENLQTLDSFLTEKTLQDLATEETAESAIDSTRAAILLQLFQLAQSLAQHRRCLAEQSNSAASSQQPHPSQKPFSISDVDSLLIYTPSTEEGGNNGWRKPMLLLNPCDFLTRNSDDCKDNDDVVDESKAASAALLRWTGLILGDVLNSSFASVEEFMRSSSRHRRPRLDVRLCDAIRRLRADIVSFSVFLARVTLLLQLFTQSNLMRKLRSEMLDDAHGCGSGEDAEEGEEERFREKLIRLCGVEEARVTGDLIRVLFQSMESEQIFTGARDRAEFDFDNKMALASATRNAQWLTRVRNDNFARDSSIIAVLSALLK